jgi:hypothetical protein
MKLELPFLTVALLASTRTDRMMGALPAVMMFEAQYSAKK